MSDDTKLIDQSTGNPDIDNMSDSELMKAAFSIPGGNPWEDQSVLFPLGGTDTDPDGFDAARLQFGSSPHIRAMQRLCWIKFQTNPQIRSSVMDRIGRVSGEGFSVSSEIFEIDEFVRKINTDPRNRLYLFWPKYFGRADVEGELFLSLTAHKKDGFVEVDFRDPGTLEDIYFHPQKPQMPLFYRFCRRDNVLGSMEEIIPSIFIAYYPELWEEYAVKAPNFNATMITNALGGSGFKKLGGFKRFIVSWDKTMLTARNVSHLSTTIQWINQYESLKRYEIDHKKSCGAYVHDFSFEDKAAFKGFLALSNEELAKTGVMQKMTPGSRLFLPVGMKHEIKSPTLGKITDTDNDIMMMVTSGLNQPEDMVTGQSKGTYSTVKNSRGPQSDRMSDESTFFERFMRYDFYRPIFFLAAALGHFPPTFRVERVIDFKKKEPTRKKVDVEPCELLDFSFPTSAISDAESVARALLGVKHGSVFSTLGIPASVVAKRLGFGDYKKLRQLFAEEEEKYPELAPDVDQEAAQEQKLEPNKTTPKSEKTSTIQPAAKSDTKPVPTTKTRTPKKA
jgi:hypothetical protein